MRAFTIDDVLARGVKDVIHEHSEIGRLLTDHHVGCVSCSVGTCRLRDVIDIHNLNEEQEHELLTRVATVVYPGRTIDIPTRTRKAAATLENMGWSPVMSTLVEEHRLIKRMLAIIPNALSVLDPKNDACWQRIDKILDFIRRFADMNHHTKEEDILFGYFDQDLQILKVMRHEHETGRTLVRLTATAVTRRDAYATREYLGSYRNLLSQHIDKEDGVLFPWLDRQLKDRAIGEIFQQFQNVRRRFTGLDEEMLARVAEFEQLGEASTTSTMSRADGHTTTDPLKARM